MRLALISAILLLLGSCSNLDETVGGTCQSDADCDDRCLTNFPGGFCTLDCNSDNDCVDGSFCADVAGGVCLIACDNNFECQDLLGGGYFCETKDSLSGGRVQVCTDG